MILKRLVSLVLIGLCLSVTMRPLAAAGADDAYLVDKYNEALQKGCQPVVVKNTVAAGVLGIFFGGGLFYTGHPGGGIRDAILFPISWMWDPYLAIKAAKHQNMQATVSACRATESKMPKK